MRGSVLTYPLSYLSLKDEGGNRLFRRNWLALMTVVVILSAPFILFDANYFGDKGFLDRFGSFAAVLTGFYIAALVGVASLRHRWVISTTRLRSGGLPDEYPTPSKAKGLKNTLLGASTSVRCLVTWRSCR